MMDYPQAPGIYEIHTKAGVPLKVGIAGNLHKRLKQHLRSGGLKLKSQEHGMTLTNVVSKSSILAKHLYFDREVAPGYDLTTQEGRQAFLAEQCVITFQVTETREQAKQLEVVEEATGLYRYIGRVVARE